MNVSTSSLNSSSVNKAPPSDALSNISRKDTRFFLPMEVHFILLEVYFTLFYSLFHSCFRLLISSFIGSFIPRFLNDTINSKSDVQMIIVPHSPPLCVRLSYPQVPVRTGTDRLYMYMQGTRSRWNKHHSILCKNTTKLHQTTTGEPAPDTTMHSTSCQ